jgi:hypothetical protein
MAIGSGRNSVGGTVPVAVQETEGIWSEPSVPLSGRFASAILTEVSCVSAKGCMVIGRAPANPNYSDVSALWNGHNWLTTMLPEPSTVLLARDGLSCSSVLRCVEVGEAGSNGFDALIWLATKWIELPTIPIGNSSGIDMARCDRSGTCMIVASPTASYAVLSGLTWSQVSSLPSEPGSALQGLAVFQGLSCLGASFCVAVGAMTATLQAVSAEWTGASWHALAVGTKVSSLFSQVSCAVETFCLATGQDAAANPTFAIWNGTTWSATSPIRAFDPADVSCFGDSECMTVGQDDLGHPAAYEWKLNRWTGVTIPGTLSLAPT